MKVGFYHFLDGTSAPEAQAENAYNATENYKQDLVFMLDVETDFDDLEKIPLSEVKEYREIKPVYVSAEISSLYKVMLEQNYVPVVDDQNVFIGIVTRKNILSHLL